MPKQTNRWKLLAVRAALCAATVVATWAADQPQWGQRYSRNMVSEEKNLPDSFDPKTGQNIKWSVALGTSTYSTPVVASGKVLIGTNNDDPRDPRNQGDRGVLMCFDEKDGKFCWQLAVPKITTSVYWDWPRAGTCSTATVEGDRIYVVSNRGEVMCLDLHGMSNGNDGPFRDEGRHMVPPGQPPLEPSATDGDILWLFDMVKDCGVRQHDSAHASILLHGRFLYVNTSNGVDDTHKGIASPDAPSLIVLDKTTGRLVARDNEHIGPDIFHCTWSSPALGEVNGRPLVFFGGGNGVVYAFEAVGTGVLESRSNEVMNKSSSQHSTTPSLQSVPLLCKVWWFDCDPTAPKENIHDYLRNREQSPVNIYGMPVFHNGRVYVAVGGDMFWGKRQAWLKCMDATKTGDITRSGALWSYPLRQHTTSTPAVHDGLVFIADCGKTIHCVDVATGAVCWTHETKSDIWAAPLVADGKLFIGTRRGEFVILAATREKKLLATIDMGSPMHTSPVAANGVLYVATMNRLYAIQKSPAHSR
ncbi:MAG: PQQ-binding-like beta-propeller repeat protein [Verrucomicrobiia bacterium]